MLYSRGITERANVLRRHWDHPFNAERESSERFHKLYENIRKYDKKFFEYFRMSKASFHELQEVVRPCIFKFRMTVFEYFLAPFSKELASPKDME